VVAVLVEGTRDHRRGKPTGMRFRSMRTEFGMPVRRFRHNAEVSACFWCRSKSCSIKNNQLKQSGFAEIARDYSTQRAMVVRKSVEGVSGVWRSSVVCCARRERIQVKFPRSNRRRISQAFFMRNRCKCPNHVSRDQIVLAILFASRPRGSGEQLEDEGNFNRK
jgi:hypothetical protein